MAGRCITLFMWGYQVSYRIHIRSLVHEVLKHLGAPAEAEVLLVGARKPTSTSPNPVCVEPEDGKWPLALFDNLLDSVESTYKDHDLQSMFYSDDASMHDKPEWMRRDSVRTSVRNALKVFDTEHDVTSLCGEVRRIDEYYVTTVIQIPNSTFSQFPPLPDRPVDGRRQGYGYRSLIHAALFAVLHEATKELQNPDPGRFTHGSVRSAQEVIRVGARNFLHTPGLSIGRNYFYNDLFDALNLVASLMYEGTKSVGNLILVNPESECVEFLARFSEPVPLHEPRWVRKVLQMASTGMGIVADSRHIYGLGKLKDSHDAYAAQDAFTATFLDHYHWELRCGDQVLIRSHYGVPKLPQEPFEKVAFLANYARLFPRASPKDGLHLWSLLLFQMSQQHGSMVVVAEDALSEASRLGKQGTRIEPTRLTESLLRSFSCIDGTILLAPDGVCHAVGIILDGEATDQCTPSRGSRYNSGIRYVQTSEARRLAIVVSDDRTVDIIPRIRRLVSRSKIEQHVTSLEGATLDNYHDSRNWLNDHRFYVNAEQCVRVNRSLDRLDSMPREVGLLYIRTDRFVVDPEMDESYLTD
ncbi:diadenylate cyclase [Pseudomonas sp. P3C3]